MIRDHKVTRGWPHRVDTVHTIPILSGQDLDSDSGCDDSTPLSSKVSMPCVGTGVLAKKLTAACDRLSEDAIIMKDSMLEGHGVKRTTLGDSRGGGTNCDRFVCQLSSALSLLSRKVMRRIKGCSRSVWRGGETHSLPSFPFTQNHDGSTGGERLHRQAFGAFTVVQYMPIHTPFVRRDRKVPTQSGRTTWGTSFPEIFSKLEGRSLLDGSKGPSRCSIRGRSCDPIVDAPDPAPTGASRTLTRVQTAVKQGAHMLSAGER